jgi:hypothetical protein
LLVAGFEPAISPRVSQVPVVFTTGPICLFQLAGEHARRADSRRDISRYLVFRGYAPVPRALILGRIAVLRVVHGAMYLFSLTTGEIKYM